MMGGGGGGAVEYTKGVFRGPPPNVFKIHPKFHKLMLALIHCTSIVHVYIYNIKVYIMESLRNCTPL